MLDPRSPAATLVEPLKALCVEFTLADTHTMAAAHGDFADQLKAGKLAIEPHPALTAAPQHAMTRPLSGAVALERRKPAVDTSPIVAAELAVWAVLHIVRPSSDPRLAGPMNDRLEERVAIVVTEDPSFNGTMLERVSAVVGAMEALKRGGFTALLVPIGTEVIVRPKESRKRRWMRRGERSKT